MEKYLFINGSESVLVQKDKDDKVNNVYIDGKIVDEDRFKDALTDKEAFAKQAQRNKYQKFLNKQFENLIILTGAGSSVGIGANDENGKKKEGRLLSHLWDDVEMKYTKEKLKKFCALVHYTAKDSKGEYVKNLESLLSMANAAKEYVTDKDIDIKTMIDEIQQLIKESCELVLPDDAPHLPFLEKITKRKVTLPRVKIFTLNYDTLFEQAALKKNFTLIDGFSFSFPRYFSGRNFDYDIVLRNSSRVKEEDNFVTRVLHLYKPHGSVDWEKTDRGIKQSEKVNKALMIYPKDSKYESSYEQPFFEMMARFQQSLRKENVMLVCIGFSFNDKHIVTVIQEALEQNPSFQIMVVNRSIKEKGYLKWLYDLSFKHSNICLVSEEFKEFAENYPDLQTYNQDEYRAIKINLSESHE